MEISAAGGLNRLIAGRYRLIEPIGHGGMATVYRGLDEALGRDIAVKLFRASAVDPDDVGRQETEMRLLASLSHPGLVTLYDAGKDDAGRDDGPDGEPRAFLVMELVDGPDLRKRLRDAPVPASNVAYVGAELAGALAYIHTRGVIHRDVKPANILLPPAIAGTAPRAKLTDFGIARMIDGARYTATGATLGTANYLSPEQASGRSASGASDIYSLGLVLLECLTGRIEFGGTPLEAAVSRLSRDPEVPSSLGPQWVSLLTGMTARDPDSRPTAAEVSAALLDYRWAAPAVPAASAVRAHEARPDSEPPTGETTADGAADDLQVPGTDTAEPAGTSGTSVADARTPAMERAAAAYLAGDEANHPDIHTPAAPPTPPSIGRIAHTGTPAGTESRTESRKASRSGRRNGARAALAPAAALPLQPGRAVLAGRALLAVLAMTVLTVAVVLAAGRVGADDSVNRQPVPGHVGGTSTGSPP
ncbi:serine/threonine-protein kinase [Arthrobacter gandavensis]|uniref:non-specific serine/threonine protein kinase n=1 Tax=Arthrobacter gandavensis TaxID=169960 RepID=A0ABN2PEG8_9MICC|nr:serine/threonine-protein kinase [Arthrobacter citreus]